MIHRALPCAVYFAPLGLEDVNYRLSVICLSWFDKLTREYILDCQVQYTGSGDIF